MKNNNELNRFKDLFKIGAISCIAVSILVLFAIIAYFIWPYKPLQHSTEQIFLLLNKDKLGGLLSLDLTMLIICIINIFPTLALYASLKRINKSFALIAIVFGLLGVASVIAARPLVEMVTLSNKYAQAATVEAKNLYISAGETYRVLFDGTAWNIQTIFFMISGLINSILMLKSEIFNKKIAWIGIISSILGMGYFLPTIGLGLLFANTIMTIPWSILVARVFIKLGWNK